MAHSRGSRRLVTIAFLGARTGMKAHDPSFQDRVGAAAKARQKALDQLKAKPPVDEVVLAERRAAAVAREAAEAGKRAEKLAAREREKTEKTERAAQAEAAAAPPAGPTDAERKAARDARYAARKGRK